MDQAKQYCMRCMTPMNPGSNICPACSYDHQGDNPQGTLPAGTVLADRYLVGSTLKQNDLTTIYIGLDRQRGRKVLLEEFMPRSYAHRGDDCCEVMVSEENQTRYKTLLSDIADRWKRLGAMDYKGLNRIRELLQLNNTVYSVTSYLAYVTLEDFLDSKGPLEWSDAKGLLLPLLTLVSNLHNKGIVHCGISPENVVLDRKGTLRLQGFALPELRTVGSGLIPELYAGYSAPEQYSKNMWQGEWTDIYSLGALLYRMLTGTKPISAPKRLKGDTLQPVSTLKPAVPAYVSQAVGRAMALGKKDRFLSIDELTAALLEETSSNTTVFRPEPAKAKPIEKEGFFADRGRLVLLGLAVSAVLNIVLAAWLLSVIPMNPAASPSNSPLPQVMEENLIGIYYPMMENLLVRYPDLVVETEEVYNETVPVGVVIDQSVKAGEAIAPEQKMIITISKGTQYMVMPSLEGCSLRTAQDMLSRLELRWRVPIPESDELFVPVGTVVCDTAPGTKMKKGDEVILTVKVAASEEPTTPGEESSSSAE